jgi:hypothetical protein
VRLAQALENALQQPCERRKVMASKEFRDRTFVQKINRGDLIRSDIFLVKRSFDTCALSLTNTSFNSNVSRRASGSSTATASQACADLGGTFNEVDRCPSAGRVLRCAIEESSSRILYSYYAPNYTEASAADICSSRGGKCVRGAGD